MTVRVVDTREDAEKLRSVFYGKSSRRRQALNFTWPGQLVDCGKVISVIYSSDKWYFDKEYRDYMHIAEAPQQFLARPGFVRDDDMSELELVGDDVELVQPMPRDIAVLAPCLGLRVDFYTAMGRGGKPKIQGTRGLREINTPGATLGGIHHPVTKQPFLVVYTPRGGVHCIVTGRELAIEKDGIVG